MSQRDRPSHRTPERKDWIGLCIFVWPMSCFNRWFRWLTSWWVAILQAKKLTKKEKSPKKSLDSQLIRLIPACASPSSMQSCAPLLTFFGQALLHLQFAKKKIGTQKLPNYLLQIVRRETIHFKKPCNCQPEKKMSPKFHATFKVGQITVEDVPKSRSSRLDSKRSNFFMNTESSLSFRSLKWQTHHPPSKTHRNCYWRCGICVANRISCRASTCDSNIIPKALFA